MGQPFCDVSLGMLSSTYILTLLLLAFAGACVGRVLVVAIDRFPKCDLDSVRQSWKSVFKGRFSECSACGASQSLTGRLPILGTLLQRRCVSCSKKRPLHYPVFETLTAVLFVLVYYCEVPDAEGWVNGLKANEGPRGPEAITALWSPGVWLHLRYALHMFMVCGLIVATEIDRRLRVIPDGSTVPVTWVAIIAAGFFGQTYIVPLWFQDDSIVRVLRPMMPTLIQPLFVAWNPTELINEWPRLHGLLVSLAGAAAGAGSIALLRVLGFWILKQEAMGYGDVVLMGAIGAVIGWQPVLTVFMLAPMLAIAFALLNLLINRDQHIPYGPFLSAAAVLLLLTWPVTWPMAKRFFDLGPVFLVFVVVLVLLLAASLQLVYLLKKLFGLETAEPLFDDGGWSSADHLQYYNSERPDEQTGQWKRESWSGCRSGRGLGHQHRWRND